MSQYKRTKRRSPMAAVLAVLLILAGVAAIAGSLWMQENEINTGAELYDTLSEQLKLPPTTDDAGYTVATITTCADGTANTGWLPYGRYTVSEVQALERYINSGFSTMINAFENGKTYTITVENSPMQGGIRLTKTDSMTGTPIAGVEFDIYDTNGTLVACLTTDAGGVATAPSLSKDTYIVREHGNPSGYVAALEEMSAEVVSDETADLFVTNDPIQGRIRIVKKDAVTGDLLSGAEFTVTRISGIPAHHGAGDGAIVATITTDTNGVAESPLLTYGTYRINETVAPSGYVNSSYSKEVTISEDNLQTTCRIDLLTDFVHGSQVHACICPLSC